jgi:hypothetical protein
MAGVGGVRKSMTQSPTAAESQFAMDSLAQLLQRPAGTWMCCDVAMDQPPAAVLNDYKHIQQTKSRGHGNE